MAERHPLLVVTGFLGSGKTTLVQRFLADPAGRGTGVVVNEFGEAGLDHSLVVHAAEHVELVGGGCMCCARREDIGRALYGLVGLAKNADGPGFRRAVVETSGLADPAPIVATLARDPWLRNNVALAGVLAVVDAVAGLRNLERHGEARRQVAIADRVVVTKTDLRAAEPVASIAAAARGIAPDVTVHDAGDPELSFADLFAARADAGSRPRARPAMADGLHDDDIGSFTLDLPAAVDWPAFTVWLSCLLHAHGDRILRVKGLVRSAPGTAPLVIHGVQHTMHPPVHLAGPDDGRASFLVFIARGPRRDEVAASLDRFLRMTGNV